MNKLQKIGYDVIMGILPVMIGVYLGIYFNNQNERKKQEELKSRIVQSLIIEWENNERLLNASYSYLTMLHDSSFYLINQKLPFQQFRFWKGLNPPELSTTAFQTAQITNVLPDLSLEVIQALSKSYTSLDDLNQLSKEYTQSVTNKIGTSDFTNEQYLNILSNYSFDMMVAEQKVLKELTTLTKLLTKE